jgi:hypothetical protein
MLMRALVIATLLAPLAAHADDLSGAYDVKFTEQTGDCHYQSLKSGALKIAVKKNTMTINIETVPQMVGVPQKNGKVEVKSKRAPSIIQGADAVYSAGGRIADGGMLELVLAAEFTNKGNALCTQTWKIVGVKQKP